MQFQTFRAEVLMFLERNYRNWNIMNQYDTSFDVFEVQMLSSPGLWVVTPCGSHNTTQRHNPKTWT